MLDEFGTEMENTESKLDSTMKKVAKVLHISNGEYKNCNLNQKNILLRDVTSFHMIKIGVA